MFELVNEDRNTRCGPAWVLLVATASLLFALIALRVVAQDSVTPFGTVHVVDASAEPGSDWIAGIAKGLTADDGAVWVFDASSEKLLLRPDDIAGAGDKGRKIDDVLRSATVGLQLRSGDAGAVIDVSQLRSLFSVLEKVEYSYGLMTGSDPERAGLVNVVLWADRLTVASIDADLSAGYVPEGCFGTPDQPGRVPEFLSLHVPETLYVQLHVRSLRPDVAAATAEAMSATLAQLFVNPSDGMTVPLVVTEAPAGCNLGAAPELVVAALAPATPDTNCYDVVPVSPMPSVCTAPDPFEQPVVVADNSGQQTPSAPPVAATPPSSADPVAADPQQDPAEGVAAVPPVKEVSPPDTTVAEKEVSAASVPAQELPPPEIVANATEAEVITPPAAVVAEEVSEPEVPAVETVPETPEVDPDLPPAKSAGLSTASSIFSVVAASSPVLSAGVGFSAQLTDAPQGIVLRVVKAGQSPTSPGALTVRSTGRAGRVDLVEDPVKSAESGFFDIYIAVDPSIVCALGRANFMGRVALPVPGGAQVAVDYAFVLSPVRCVDATETILVIDQIEVP